MSPEYTQQKEMERLVKQNSELLSENNRLLKKIYRNAMLSFWLRVVWYVLLIGMPFALYFLLEPYFTALGSSYETFNMGMQEIPGLKQMNALLETYQSQEGVR